MFLCITRLFAMTHTLIVQAHPDPNSFHSAMADAYAKGAAEFGTVSRLQVADLEFDPTLRFGFREGQTLEPDLVRAQEAIQRADHVAWVFPTWWAGVPAALKGLIDRAFLPGWAFQNVKGRPLPVGLLAGRSARLVTGMDSPSFWYTLAHNRALHGSFKTATLKYVGFGPVRSTTVYSVRTLSAKKRARILARLERTGAADARRAPARKALTAGSQHPAG